MLLRFHQTKYNEYLQHETLTDSTNAIQRDYKVTIKECNLFSLIKDFPSFFA